MHMVQALPVHARTVPTSLRQNILRWRSFVTIARLNRASVSTAAGAIGNCPPTDLCRVGHGVAHFSSSAYNNFYRIGCREFSSGFTAWDTDLLCRSRLWSITVPGISPSLFIFVPSRLLSHVKVYAEATTKNSL